MPWSLDDVESHIKGLTSSQKAAWVKIANSVLTGCLEKGTSQSTCEGQAIRIANAKAKLVAGGGALETVDLDNIEVMEAGHWNTSTGEVDITVENLDKIVEVNASLSDQLKPPLVIGHERNQRWMADTGYPSAGWLENIRRNGSKLVADIKAVPSKLADLIKKGAYRMRSVEVGRFVDKAGVEYGNVLLRLALLGGTLPAMGSLADVEALYSQEPVMLFQMRAKNDNDKQGGDSQVEEKDIRQIFQIAEEADIVEFMKETAEKLATIGTITKEKTDLDNRVKQLQAEVDKGKGELTKKVEDLQLQLRTQDCDKVITQALNQGRIAPAAGETCKEAYMKDPEGTKKLIESMPEKSFGAEEGAGSGKPDESQLTPKEAELHAKLSHSKEDIEKYSNMGK